VPESTDKIVAWMLLCLGITVAVTVSRAGAPVRAAFDWLGFRTGQIGETLTFFIRCPACVGWWVGLLFAALVPSWRGPLGVLPMHPLCQMLGDAFASSAVCWMVMSVVQKGG
jgi:hypothetical protein